MGRKAAVPPSLSQLGAKRNSAPNIDYMRDANSDQDNNLKREYLFKFDLLKKSYKDAKIPEFTIHSDIKQIKQSYEDTVKNLKIGSSVDWYRQYLIGGFMFVEYALGNWLGLDMKGFTSQQLSSMSTYDRLLVELGEKSYVDEESQWPVELRLLGVIAMNAAFFVGNKMVIKKTGADVINMISSLNTNTSSSTTKKRPMRGPNINFDNIPESPVHT